MEQFPQSEKPIFEERLRKLIEKGRKELEGVNNENKEEILHNASILEQKLPSALSNEAVKFLESQPEEDFDKTIVAIYRYYTGNEDRSLENIPALSVDNIKNLLLYKKVYGYDHPNVEKRETENPIPTVQELLLGCYVEQLEEQTRDAVLILREKGYQTVESGFYNKIEGSQFFHLEDARQAAVSEKLISEIKEKFSVTISIEDTHIELTPSKYKTIEEWRECLNFFAENMPRVAEETFAPVGGSSVHFAMIAIQKFPLEEVLKTAKNSREEELIRKLYRCTTEKGIAELMKINQG